MKASRQPSGFTLLELLVAVVLIVTVVGIVYGSVMTAARSSQRTRQHLNQCQRSALALDQIAHLLREGLPNRETRLPQAFTFAANSTSLLRFVSRSRWQGLTEPQPILNEMVLNQGQLQWVQSLLSPDLAVVVKTAAPQVLLDHVSSVRVQCWQHDQWLAFATSWPLAVHLEVVTQTSSDYTVTQRFTVACPPSHQEVTP